MNCQTMRIFLSTLVFMMLLFTLFLVVSEAGRDRMDRSGGGGSWRRRKIRKFEKNSMSPSQKYSVRYRGRYDDDDFDYPKSIQDKKRDKRYYRWGNAGPAGLGGCSADYDCCENPYCSLYCDLCNADPYPYERIFFRLPCDKKDRTFDEIGNIICKEEEGSSEESGGDSSDEGSRKKAQGSEESDESLEKVNAQAGSSTTTTAKTTTSGGSSEEDLDRTKAQASGGSSEESLERTKAQAGGSDEDAGRKANGTRRGQFEFTHHIYEEYLPTLPERSKPPIILQTIPQYSVANYFSLSKHQHPSLPRPPPPPPKKPQPPPSHYPPQPGTSHPQLPFVSPSASSDIGLLHHHQQQQQHQHHRQHHLHLYERGNKKKNYHHAPLFYGDMSSNNNYNSNDDNFMHNVDNGNDLSLDPHHVPVNHLHHHNPPNPPPMRHVSNQRPEFESESSTNLHHLPPDPFLPNAEFDQPSLVQLQNDGNALVTPDQVLHQDHPLFKVQVEANNNQQGLIDPLLQNRLPQPQTIILDQNAKPSPYPPSPQPVLKYHLIRHSFPAKGKEDYFADIPAYLPGPPYVAKALPSRKRPAILRRPHRTGYFPRGTKSGTLKKKPTKFGKIVQKLIG